MAEPRSTEVDRGHAEALRRRLYQPGASDDDRLRFSALRDAEAPAVTAASPTEASSAAAPAARLLRPAVSIAVVAAVALAALLLVAGRAGPSGAPAASRAAAVVTAGAEIRRELVAVQSDAPVATTIPTSLAGVATRLQRFHGRGRTVVPVDTAEAQQVDGTLLVMLTATPVTAVDWAATRPARQPGHAQFVEIVATGQADRPGGLPAYGMHVYDGSPPSRLLVEARRSDAWTLTVAFLPRRQSEQ